MPKGTYSMRALLRWAASGLVLLWLLPGAQAALPASPGMEFMDASSFMGGPPGGSSGPKPAQRDGWNGRYALDTVLNNKTPLGTLNVGVFGPNPGPHSICLTAPSIKLLRVKPSALLPQALALLKPRPPTQTVSARADSFPVEEDACLEMEDIVADGGSRLDVETLTVYVWFPQAYAMAADEDDLRDLWADSATVGVLGYNLNAYEAFKTSSSSQYLGLNARLSAGNWSLDHRGAVSQTDGAATAYQTSSFTASTGIAALRSTLTLGSLYAGGGLFDGTAMEGAVLATDSRMLPASQRSYAPMIRGQALGNANVEVWQFGKLVHSMTVPPGPFVIDKLYALAFGGELTVIVKEADGTQRSFTVPYAPTVDLLPVGSLRYSLAAGEVTKSTLGHPVLEGTIRYGLSGQQTVQAGVQWAENYNQLLLGSSFSTALGAVGFNLRRSALQLPAQDLLVGGRGDLSWMFALPATSTRLSLVTSRYSSFNYYDLSEAMGSLNAVLVGNTAYTRYPTQVVTSANIQQPLASGGYLYLSGTSTTKWDRSYNSLSYQLGYSFRWRQASISLSTTYYEYASGQTSSLLALGLSIPLEVTKNKMYNAYTSLQQDQSGNVSSSVGVSSAATPNDPFSYGVNMSESLSTQTTNGNLSYQGTYANLSASASGTNQAGLNQLSFGATGAVLAHRGGVSLAPYLGDAFAIVQVKDGEGVRIADTSSTPVDRNGYAVVPYLNPYANNTLRLDTTDAEPGLEFEEDTQTVVPRAGTGVFLSFEPRAGQPALIRAKLETGKPLPFAAELRNDKGELVGTVGQGGQVQARLMETSGVLYASWGDDAETASSCALPYQVAAGAKRAAAGILQFDGVCTTTAQAKTPTAPYQAQDAAPATPRTTQAAPPAPAPRAGEVFLLNGAGSRS
jgi:outer membrane usher protein